MLDIFSLSFSALLLDLINYRVGHVRRWARGTGLQPIAFCLILISLPIILPDISHSAFLTLFYYASRLNPLYHRLQSLEGETGVFEQEG
jgi:hypothetical protein